MFSSAQLLIVNHGRGICDFYSPLWRILCQFTFRPLYLSTDVHTHGLWIIVLFELIRNLINTRAVLSKPTLILPVIKTLHSDIQPPVQYHLQTLWHRSSQNNTDTETPVFATIWSVPHLPNDNDPVLRNYFFFPNFLERSPKLRD